MKTQLTKIRRSIMGTTEFTAKFDGMRQAQDFIVYPIAKDGSAKKILCQSGSRWLEIDVESGKCDITSAQSGHHNSWLLVLQKTQGKNKSFALSQFDLSALKMHIFTTADKNAGNRVITTDNSGAINII